MSTIQDGYIVEADEDGVGIIPPPPKHDSYSSMGSSLPSRDSVSAAIALVRAKQMAKSAIQKVELQQQVLQPRSFSSSASEASVKSKVSHTSSTQSLEVENAAPTMVLRMASADNKSMDVESSPSLPSSDSEEDDDFVDPQTLNDVNAFLTRLGVGVLASDSAESVGLATHSVDSIEKLRMLTSGGASQEDGDDSDDDDSSTPEVEPEKLAEISAFIDAIHKKASMKGEEVAEDPPSNLNLEVPDYNGEPPLQSEDKSEMDKEDDLVRSSEEVNPFLDQDEDDIVESTPPFPMEEEKKSEDDERSFRASRRTEKPVSMHHTLSTVEEAESMEADEGDEDKASATLDQQVELAPAVSEDQESVYGADGRKEPKGTYKEAEVAVEKIPMPNVGVEQAMTCDMSVMSTDSLKKTTMQAVPDMDDAASVPWALRDVASEETMRATGRRRPQFVVSGPRPSNKSRNVVSLFDDTSIVTASVAPSELQNDGSFASEHKSAVVNDDNDEEKDNAKETNNATSMVEEEIEATDSLDEEANNKCFVDNILYTDYDPEDDYAVQRGLLSNDTSKSECDLVVAASGEVEIVETEVIEHTSSQFEQVLENSEELNLKQDPSGEMAGFGAGHEKLGTIAASIDDKANGEKRHFKALLAPLIDGHKPTLVESAQIRQAAKKANVSLELVDQFLDDCNEQSLQVLSNTFSLDELYMKSFGTSFEQQNEKDEDIGAFMGRLEEARIAAVRREISAAASGVEKVFKAEEAGIDANIQVEKENAMAAEAEAEEEPNTFLKQFEELGLEDDSEHEEDSKQDDAEAPEPTKPARRDMSPAALINYFSTLDNRKLDEEVDEKLMKDFKKLIAPVMDGKKPTIIEEAQLRQAALKASVPLEFVDKFVDYVKDDHPLLTPQVSKEDDKDFLLKGWEDIDDIDEDDAIAAFLSAKFGKQMEEERKRAAKALKDSIREKKAKELMGRGSRDYEPENDSVTSTVEPQFTATQEETTNCDTIDYETAESALSVETKESSESEESVEKFSFAVPKVVGTFRVDENVKKQESDPIDEDMLHACKTIESYDESVWQRRTAMATYGWEWKEALWLSQAKSPKASNLSGVGVNGMDTVKDVSNLLFNKKAFPVAMKNSKLSYNRRTKPHGGYFDVDMHSLQESAAFGEENVQKDETPWELRYVRQRFLHERSLASSRNWFGDLVKTNGNDKIKAPICKPKSMEMPMRKIPDPGDWTPEWYTSWNGQRLMRRRSSGSFDDSCSDSGTERDTYYGRDSLQSYSSGSTGSYTDDEEDWEDAPECGTIVNTKQKIGEHVSRVHPDYTSSLRKSRWRKKYFPIGTFPY